jgi:beta-glucosidase
MRIFASVLLGLGLAAGAAAQEPVPEYKNPRLPIEQRVQDLLKRMTVEEKVEEIAGGFPRGLFAPPGEQPPPEFRQLRETARRLFSPEGRPNPRESVELRNQLQRFRMEKSRLGIPSLFMGEALHGFMANGSTSFPQVLGLASTWDLDLVRQVFTAAGDEMASGGVRQAFTPVLDLGRDPRWGRTEETYGEDPFLVSRMAVSAVQGLQGTSFLIDQHHVIATPKHFAAHGQPEGGRNTAPANYSERILREEFLLPFQAAIEEGHAGSVMASYNEINGVPSHINHWLLTDVLRKEWGFDGFVVSDGGGLQMLVETHQVAADFAEAARKALVAGVDFDLSNGEVYRTLVEQVKQGKVAEADLDRAVARILTAKFRLGLFEHPYTDPDIAERVINSPEHQKLALKTAQEAIVLLKNRGNLLPLDLKKIKTIAVIGPNAADVHVGGYSREPGHQVSILDGIRNRVGPDVNVLFAQGCKITAGLAGWSEWYENNVKLADPVAQDESIHMAAEAARRADVAVVVVGENEGTNREAWAETHQGDRDSLDLLGLQDELVQAVLETGTPTVVLLINGRPLSINSIAEHAPAILEGWYLGEEGGTAAANVLFGDVNPGGKLPITFPRSVGQLPDYYDHKPSRNRSYTFTNSAPLFPFGYGLSYTTFRFDHLRVEPATISEGGAGKVSVNVTNTGDREGDEVAELYIHQRVASVTQPVMQLKGFRRVHLKPGETTTVDFALTAAALSILDINMQRVTEPGLFDVMVGPSSAETTSVTLEVAKK